MGKRRFMCFRMSSGAVVGDDEEIEPAKGCDESSMIEVEGTMSRRRRRRLVPRFISRLLRSRSSEGSQKLLQIKIRSESQPELKRFPESFSKSSDIDEEDRLSGPIFTSSASSSSSLSSSMSSTSSIASASTSPIMATETPPVRRRRPPVPLPPKKFCPVKSRYNTTTGLCILLVSLSVLVFSGKLCAILWTSTCLCLTPRRSSGGPLPPTAVVRRLRSTSNLEGEKKRIVMEGFLERNRKV